MMSRHLGECNANHQNKTGITQNSFPFVSFDKEGIVNVFIKTVLP